MKGVTPTPAPTAIKTPGELRANKHIQALVWDNQLVDFFFMWKTKILEATTRHACPKQTVLEPKMGHPKPNEGAADHLSSVKPIPVSNLQYLHSAKQLHPGFTPHNSLSFVKTVKLVVAEQC